MGTIIKSVATQDSAKLKEVIPLISQAAKSCIDKSGLSIGNIGMLVNIGLYSENHLTEPAKAALIQNSLNKKYVPLGEEWQETGNLFSFDLHSGGGGIINAFEVMDSFIQSNEIENGLIVSGDIKPETGVTENYNYKTGAAAVLISNSNKKRGFVKFKTKTYTEFISNFKSATNWDTGKLMFTIKQYKHYLSNCVECTVNTIDEFLHEEKLTMGDIDLILTSQSPKGFSNNLQNNLNENKIIHLNNNREIFSSGLLYSLNQTFYNNEFDKAKNLLFITVGAGITVSLAYYKNYL